jgi:hypothetical protein
MFSNKILIQQIYYIIITHESYSKVFKKKEIV